jgi:hypothetical protein
VSPIIKFMFSQILLVVLIIAFTSCSKDLYLTVEPTTQNVSGNYEMNGFIVIHDHKIRKQLQRNKPEMTLRNDGTFVINRFPLFNQSGELTLSYTDSLSISGSWKIKKFDAPDSINGNAYIRWGIILDSVTEKLTHIEITGRTRPRGIRVICKQPDPVTGVFKAINLKKK